MLWAIVSTFFDSLASITRKKSLELNTLLSAYGFKILGMFGPIMIVPYFLVSKKFSFDNISFSYIFFVFCVCCVRIVSTNLSQYIYKNEKVTVLMPYENLNKVLSILASFFLLKDGNIQTVIVAFIVILLLLFSSIDIKNIRLPRVFALVFLHETLVAIKALLTAFVLKKIGSYVDYYILESAFLGSFLILGVWLYKDISKFPSQTKFFYSYRLAAGLLGAIANVISLYLISSVGLINSIILSFLGIVMKLCMGSFILKEKLKTKNIFMALGITGLVAAGFFLK